ncbi:AAA family ATPase [Treponema parvum]|uniref:AAA family ATPase n=1 Tax=Treponema parvum TaxID=138851 RepID=A0A975F2S1_9SPIR|nr:ATP-binding protein [Treponema parvum]QTQ13323.1 AAA family ATPase [Treponema parvum]
MSKFYDRKKELALLGQIERNSSSSAAFTVMTGRRRIGKTALLKKFLERKKSCYLFTTRNSESLLCRQWQKELEEKIGLKIFGNIYKLADLFEQIMLFSTQRHFILVIDEFQDLKSINPAFFSEMQNIWDSNKDNSKINLIVCGSVYSMMIKIFEDSKEPLFGRATAKINLRPFTPSVCKEILKAYNPDFNNEDLLCLYMLSGGVAKYMMLLMDSGSTTKEKMIDYVTGVTSPFLIDGKDVLINEMGKDYGIYFSILSLISNGMTAQNEIDSIIQKNTGAYLSNLYKIYDVIQPIKPLYSKAESRNVRWQITDSYLRFYFRFIYSNQNLVELGQYDVLKTVILRDYETFTGRTLEQYFTEKIKEETQLTLLGGWRDRKSQNEIDIIAVNDLNKTCSIYEVKRKAEKINLKLLEEKGNVFKSNVPGYSIEFSGLSMENM